MINPCPSLYGAIFALNIINVRRGGGLDFGDQKTDNKRPWN